MAYGLWAMGYGLWAMAHGPCLMAHDSCPMPHGPRPIAHGLRVEASPMACSTLTGPTPRGSVPAKSFHLRWRRWCRSALAQRRRHRREGRRQALGVARGSGFLGLAAITGGRRGRNTEDERLARGHNSIGHNYLGHDYARRYPYRRRLCTPYLVRGREALAVARGGRRVRARYGDEVRAVLLVQLHIEHLRSHTFAITLRAWAGHNHIGHDCKRRS